MRYCLFFLLLVLLSCANHRNQDFIETNGIIEATEILISSKVNSQVMNIFFEEGTSVRKDDTLAVLDSEFYKYQYEQALALETIAKAQLELLKKGARTEDVRQAEELLKQAEESLLKAKSDYERYLNLKEKKSISQKQFEDVELNLKLMQSRYQQARENLQKVEKLFRKEEIVQAEANLKKASANVSLFKKYLSDCFVISPTKCVVVKKFVEVGENVGIGFPLFKLAKLDTMEMTVYVPENTLGKIKLGQEVEITIDTYPDKKYLGKVVYISSEAEFTPKNIQTKDERVTLVFGIKIKIPNLDNELKMGMPADAKILISKEKN